MNKSFFAYVPTSGVVPHVMAEILLEKGKGSIPELEKLIDAGIKLLMGGWIYFQPDWFEGDTPYGLNERIAKAGARIMSERLAKVYKLFKEDKFLLEQAKKPTMISHILNN